MSQQISVNNEHTSKKNNLPLIALCLGFFMIIIDATIVNTALPDIGQSLSATLSGLQWVTAGYTLVFACLLLSAGSLGDRIGARRVFITGLCIFTIASVTCGSAPSLWILITSRIVQGVGAAMALPTSLALINASYPDRESRVRAIGVWGGLGGIAAGLGPVLGGVLTEWINWRSIFYINLPIGIIGIFLTLRYVTCPVAKNKQDNFDLAGQLLSIIAVASLAYSLIEAHQLGWNSSKIRMAFIITILSVIAFIFIEKYISNPMLPLNLFANKEFRASVFVGAVINTSFYGELFLLALYFHNIRHFSPLIAGLAMLPQPGITSIASLLGGKHTARFGPRSVILIGLITGSLGMLALTQSTAHSSYWLLVLPLMAVGFGTGYTMPAATAATMEAAPQNLVGTASGVLNASRQIGSTLGVALFGSLVASADKFMHGYQVSGLIGCIIFAIGALIAFISIPIRSKNLA